MDEALTFRERFQQGTAYMSEELKSIEKNATGIFQEPENQQLEREYMSAMQQGHARMRLFGINETSFGKMESATTEVMKSYCEERKEASRIRQITESGKKKKSHQETDAQARMGSTVYDDLKRSAAASAANVLQKYREKKEQNLPPADTAMQGTEFYAVWKNRSNDEQAREAHISDLLLKRDALVARVKNAAPQSTTERLEAEYDQQLLEKLNDVLQTWMKAGGITEAGKRVSVREKTKAIQHLPLAVESYEYYAKNRDMLIGGMLFERIKKTDAYKEKCLEVMNMDKESSRQILDIDQPIMDNYKNDIVNLRTLIAENGPYDAEMQKLITNVYGEYMQHSVAFANLNQEMRAANMTVQQDEKVSDYLKAWQGKNNFVAGQHEMAMDAAAAYLKYLIMGTTPDPTLAVYIEKHWNTNAFVEVLDRKVGDLYADTDEYDRRITERIEQLEQDTHLSQDRKSYYADQLRGQLHGLLNRQAERLLACSPKEIELKLFTDKCKVTQSDPVGGGYRDIPRLMMSLNGTTEDLDENKVNEYKCALYRFAEGKHLADKKDKKRNMPCTKEERLADIPVLIEVIEHAYVDLHAYVEEHTAAFEKQSLEEAYRSVETMTKVYKKAQAMSDTCSRICKKETGKTSVFDELEETVQHRLIELWDFSSALRVLSEKRLTIIAATQEQTYRELTEGETDIDILGSSLEEFILGAHKTHEEILAAQGSNI